MHFAPYWNIARVQNEQKFDSILAGERPGRRA